MGDEDTTGEILDDIVDTDGDIVGNSVKDILRDALAD